MLRSRRFFLMFGVIFLLSLNFTLLRSVRNTLAVVDLGGGAMRSPFLNFSEPCRLLF